MSQRGGKDTKNFNESNRIAANPCDKDVNGMV